MKKVYLFLLILVGFISNGQAQGKFFTKNGHISFFSHTDMEDIEGNNNKVASVWDAASGQIEFAVLMKAFEFKKALMEEHFNENYVESDKYPKATFKGKIVNMNSVDLSKDGTYPVNIEGDLSIKNVSKPVKTTGKIVVKNGLPQGLAEFNIKPEDYNIQIPAVVRKNIAEQVKIKVDMAYQSLNK